MLDLLNSFKIKQQFEIPDDVTYLNTAGIGPLMKSSVLAGEKGLKIKQTPWLMGEQEFFDHVDDARALFAKLIHAEAEDIAIIPSATYGVETAFLNVKLQAGDEVLVQSDEFPSIVLPAMRRCKQTGAHLKTVAFPKDYDWTAPVLQQINSRTRVIALSPCHWTDGSLIDLEKVSQAAKQVQAMLIVDVCQAAGAFPLDVRKFAPDFLVAPTYKWLLGPYSFGFLYVAPAHQTGEALEQYWASREGARDFSRLTSYNPQYAKGATRFDMGERSQFINVQVAISALEQILEWKVENIANHLKKIIDELAFRAESMGYEVPPPALRAPHFLGLRRPQGYDSGFQNDLIEKKIYVSFRGDSLRVAPHLFNTLDDLDRLASVLSF